MNTPTEVWIAMAWHKAEHDDPSEVLENCLIETGPTALEARNTLDRFLISVGDDPANYFITVRSGHEPTWEEPTPAPNKLFTWDDLSFDLLERDPQDLFHCNAEGGWISEGFLYSDNADEDGIAPHDYEHGQPAVEVRENGRFVGLETWAPDEQEARRRFRWHERFATTEKGDADEHEDSNPEA